MSARPIWFVREKFRHTYSCNLSGVTLNPATSCILGVEFTPGIAGGLSGGVVLTDNSNPDIPDNCPDWHGGSADRELYAYGQHTDGVDIAPEEKRLGRRSR